MYIRLKTDLLESNNNSSSKTQDVTRNLWAELQSIFSLKRRHAFNASSQAAFLGEVESYWRDMDNVFITVTDSKLINKLHLKRPL